jgi:transposase
MKPEQVEIERLRREVAKLKAERDLLKRGPPRLQRRSWMAASVCINVSGLRDEPLPRWISARPRSS